MMSTKIKSAALDMEKHSEVSRSSKDLCEGNESIGGDDIDDSEDDDEFGGADEHEQANPRFLRELKQDYQSESELSTPTLLWVTTSQLQSRLPMGLDNEKHDDMTDLRQNCLTTSKSKRHLLVEPEEDNDIADSSDEEFGNANDSDEPMPGRLRDSWHCRTLAPPVRGLPSAGLFGRGTAALDIDKHEEIGHLLDSRHARGLDSTRNTRTILTADNTFDEFGDARPDEAAVNSYLQDAKQEMLEVEGRGKSSAPGTPSQADRHIPEGLDKGKHEDIGNLMDSYRYESYDEFEDGSLHDLPHQKFLYDSTHTRTFSDVDEDEMLHNSDEILMGLRDAALTPSGLVDAPACEDEEDGVEYEPLKGEDNDGASKPENSDRSLSKRRLMMAPRSGHFGLDHEAHDDLNMFPTSASASGTEFGSASTLDMADSYFLESQLACFREESGSLADLAEGDESS